MRLAITCDEGLSLEATKARKLQHAETLPKNNNFSSDLVQRPQNLAPTRTILIVSRTYGMSRKIAVASPHHEAGGERDVVGTAPCSGFADVGFGGAEAALLQGQLNISGIGV